ncbi:hypothetical protein SAMN03097708_00786 [Thiohalomonas denitrificans]|uniref:Uncharacterized protein n=1 Tax=Thiohalomonas denitrificans TaxID=415747 RepID=A0A1G5PU10_9GAMM|nr:hypothetical protein SAMN03097708_00786 [Thiohalomonas denitrificans]
MKNGNHGVHGDQGTTGKNKLFGFFSPVRPVFPVVRIQGVNREFFRSHPLLRRPESVKNL